MRCLFKRKLAAVMILAMFFTCITPVQSFAGTTTLNPAADKSFDIYGGGLDDVDLYIGSATTDFGLEWMKSAMRFNISSISGTITSAKLRVYISTVQNGSKLDVYGSEDTTFIETNGTAVSQDTSISVGSLSVGTGDANAWKEIDVTSYLNSKYPGASIVSFVIEGDINNGNRYFFADSSEGTNPPQLVIETAFPGTLQFSSTTATAGEGAGTQDLTVTRTSGSDGAVTVEYAVTGGTATGSGTDYTLASGTLSFADGETSKTITVNITDDGTYESDETVEVTLSNATGGASLGTDTVATLTITDDDAVPGTLQFDPTTVSAGEGAGTQDLTVTRTGGSDGAVTVDYAVTGGTATGSGTDYTLASGTLSFADTETSKTITVTLTDDGTYESDETVEVTLSNATGGASLGTDTVATLTITDDDAVPGTLQFDPTTVSAGEGAGTQDLTVTRTGGSDGAVTVDYAVTGGTATGLGTDYTLASGTLSFADTETSKTITVTLADDGTYESDETVEVTLSNATGGASLGTDTVATLTITDDDAVPGTLQFDPATVSAGEGAGTQDLTVTRTGGSDGAVTVDYAVTGGTATGSGTDYTLASGTLSFADTETSKTFTVTLTDDGTYESDETVEVTLSNATGGSSLGTDTVATLTITDDDAVPGTLQFDPTTASAGEGAGTQDLTVTRTGGSDGAVTVDYAVTGGTATGSGTDYTLADGTLSFADGETSKTITVTLTDDGTYESDETVEVTLSNATGGSSLGTDTVATLTITDDDAVPGTLQFDPTTVSAGEGAGTQDLTVTRTGGSDGAVTVDYAVTGGTATGSGTDYTLASGTLSFADTETSKTITVTLTDDGTYESDETVEVTLSNATGGASLGTDTVATLTITDDDAVPGTLQFDPTTASAGEGAGTQDLTVTRTGGSDGAVTVDYAVTGGTATGSGTDYTLASGTLSFADGETSKTFTVNITDDGTYESDETVEVTLSNATGGASLGTDTVATLTITDDDAVPGTLQFDPTTVSAGEGAGTQDLTVTRTGGSDGAVTVDYAVTGGTATGSGTDYTLASGTLSFADTETSKTITVTLADDGTYESDETVEVTLSNATGGSSLGTDKVATLTIADDDAVPGTLQFDPITATAGEGTGTQDLTVTRTSGSDGAVTVDYAVTGGTATGSGTDYTLADGTLSFADGETSKTITVSLTDDGTYESDETVEVTLSNATGGSSLGTDTVATLTITDDDAVPGTLQFDPTTVSAGEGAGTQDLTVTRTGGSDGAVTVDYAVTGGTATGSGTDYTLASGTLSFADTETSKTITVNITDDGTYESDETVEVTLSNATGGASLGTDTVVTLTITNDDVAPVAGIIQFDPISYSASEGAGTQDLTVTRIGGSDGAVAVDYSVTGGTATGSGTDFTLASGTLSFGETETSKTITVTITDDGTYESDETVEVTLSNATGGASLGTDTVATLTISDNDVAPVSGTLQFDPVSVTASEDAGTQDLTVTRTSGSDGIVTVDYAVTSGSAIGLGTDYTLLDGTLTFADGEMSKTIEVNIVDDTIVESSETIQVTLSDVTGGASLGTDKIATLTITDNDSGSGTIQFAAANLSVSENIGTASLTVEMTSTSDGAIKVDYSVSGGSASGSGVDYSLPSGTLTFSAGETSKTISLSIVNDNRTESDETIVITLTNPTSGFTLGTNKSSTVTILANDTPPKNSSSNNDDNDQNDNDNTDNQDNNTDTSQTNIKVNGKTENLGTDQVSRVNGRVTRTVIINPTLVENKIKASVVTNQTQNNSIEIPISDSTTSQVKVSLTGDIVKLLEDNNYTIKTNKNTFSYNIPAKEFSIDRVAQSMGVDQDELKSIEVDIIITQSDGDEALEYENKITANNAVLVTNPVDFQIVARTRDAEGNEQETFITRFNDYVDRVMEVPEGVDPEQITTGIVFNPDLTYSHVPTIVYEDNGKYYTKLNSLTNSSYSVIWNPVVVESVSGHWSQVITNDMASRLILMDYENYNPDQAVTRAEFTDYLIRGLGLLRALDEREVDYEDVNMDHPYYTCIAIAKDWGIVTGYPDGTFRPDEKITREDAMLIYASAMKLAGSNIVQTNQITKYDDLTDISGYALDGVRLVVNSGIFNGRTEAYLSPKASLTHAESLAAIRNLLIKSGLIE